MNTNRLSNQMQTALIKTNDQKKRMLHKSFFLMGAGLTSQRLRRNCQFPIQTFSGRKKSYDQIYEIHIGQRR
jgi:methylglyoxal synthase